MYWMRNIWFILALLRAALLILCSLTLPETLFTRMDLSGNVSGKTNRNFLVLSLFFLGGAINGLLYFIYQLAPNSKWMMNLNFPNRAYWIASEERRILLKEKLGKVVPAFGAYVNFLIASMLYMTIHYYYPHKLPCPRHLLMMLTWIVLSFAMLFYTFRQFKKGD
jgi:hypothetical protein